MVSFKKKMHTSRNKSHVFYACFNTVKIKQNLNTELCARDFLELLQSMESNGTDKLAMEVVSTGLINTYLFQINPISVCAQYSEIHSFYREIYTGSYLIHDTHTYIVE